MSLTPSSLTDLSFNEQLLYQHIIELQQLDHNAKKIASSYGWSVDKAKKIIKGLIQKNLIRSSVGGHGRILTLIPPTPIPCVVPHREQTKVDLGGDNVITSPVVNFEATTTSPCRESVLYLVDTENASNDSFYQGIEYLTEKDTILLLLTQNTRVFGNPELCYRLFQTCPAQIQLQYQNVWGKNALDFILISELSLQLLKHGIPRICVISGDKGYDIAIQHLRQQLQLREENVWRDTQFKSSEV